MERVEARAPEPVRVRLSARHGGLRAPQVPDAEAAVVAAGRQQPGRCAAVVHVPHLHEMAPAGAPGGGPERLGGASIR